MTYFLLYLFKTAVYIGSNFALESAVNKLLFAERYKELNELLDEAEFTEEEEDNCCCKENRNCSTLWSAVHRHTGSPHRNHRGCLPAATN